MEYLSGDGPELSQYPGGTGTRPRPARPPGRRTIEKEEPYP